MHGPGTVLNDQYHGDGVWDEFLRRLEEANPPIRALGVTDYYSVDVYEAVLAKKNEGRLPQVDLLFPNIEMRYGVGTGKGAPVNVHLLVSPEDPDHLEQVRRFLNALTFEAYDESFRCDKTDLIRLGRRHDKNTQDDQAALRVGTNQFKISPAQLIDKWRDSKWARENILIAVAGGSHDGTSGLQGDASLAALRKEIERNAHIIFSAQQGQREFWLGQGAASLEALNSEWGGCKPCLHGSDAHHLDQVGIPDKDRHCWIKGDLIFESLRQACFEPEARVFIGPVPPRGAMPSQVITSTALANAPWLKTTPIVLNGGLVGIIGARGSGKTALLEMLAAGGFALPAHLSDRSFVQRASQYLGDATVEVYWEAGDPTSGRLEPTEVMEREELPRVQYLSQQFVDMLCSAEGVTDELLAEIERVIYEAHLFEERMGATDFRELLEIRTARGRAIRQAHEEALASAIEELNVARHQQAALPNLRRQRAQKADSISKDKKDRSGLIRSGGSERAKSFDLVSNAVETVRLQVEQSRRGQQALLALRQSVTDLRQNKAPSDLRRLQQFHSEAGLSPENWKAFLLRFSGDVDGILAATIKATEDRIQALSGPLPGEVEIPANSAPSVQSLLPQGVELEKLPLSLLNKELARLRALIGIDSQNEKTFKRISEKIAQDEAELSKLDRQIKEAEESEARIKELTQSRHNSYAAVFDGVIEEEKELTALYAPLKARLEVEAGALRKLSFSIRRIVDAAAWAMQGEALLDLRKAGPFRGHGALLESTKMDLLPAWENGSSIEVAEAMSKFREQYESALVAHAPVERGAGQEFREWGGRISEWLYGTGHIKVTYGIQYEGVNIEQLSPGNRGIVLLLLYLAIDRDDDRPLVIDQPEENLDPKSIYEDLVGHFRRAKLRRQVIIVTHNANLVVNTDADQVIVARCGPHRPGELPEISYVSGSLENPVIRREVIEILEGGEAAFKERAKRLRVSV